MWATWNSVVISVQYQLLLFSLSVLILPHLSCCVISLFQGGPGSKLEVVSSQHSGRHLLGFSPEEESQVEMGPEPLGRGPSDVARR